MAWGARPGLKPNNIELFWHTLESMIAEAGINARYEALRPWLDERARRLLAAAESQAIGPRGVAAVSTQGSGMGAAAAVFPGVVGIITAWIAYARTRVVPLADSPRRALRAA